jgi:hypothetical protein
MRDVREIEREREKERERERERKRERERERERGRKRKSEYCMGAPLVHDGAATSMSTQQARRVTGLIRVPPPAVTLRMRWLLWSTTNTLPLASTATPVGYVKPALVPDASA